MGIPAFFEKGQPHTQEYWENTRRGEVLRLFEENVYGVTPAEKPDSAEYTVEGESSLADGTVRRRSVFARFGRGGMQCGFHFNLYTPVPAGGTLPAVVAISPFPHNAAFRGSELDSEGFPVRLITQSGYAAVEAYVGELCPDNPDKALEGLLSMFPSAPEGRAPDGWGAFGAWSWAVSRILDYFEQTPEIDEKRVAVEGCSRAGKTALWCVAQDQRIALAISCVSGCGGASFARIKEKEQPGGLAKNFPHWICPNYATYGDRVDDMPVDQHMLLGLIAPRPLYVSSAADDAFCYPPAEFKSCVLAGELYALYGKQGLSSDEFPPADRPVTGGMIEYHMRSGPHGCKLYDWEQYLRFMDKHLK